MRYQDWDVLLFPEGSKIPIQEFKTECHVIKDSESPFLSDSAFTNAVYPTGGGSLGLTPVLTSFVASLKHGDAFRVSVHSWKPPNASAQLNRFMAADDNLMFQARVFIDGVLVATHIFDNRTQWPVVIDTNSRFEHEGLSEPLRFPPFHPSILKQEHWEPNESLGRIKVVLAEGLAIPYNPSVPRRAGFDRFRDVIVFSFQHANLDVLQLAYISWPNPEMWKHPMRNAQRPAPIGTKPVSKLDQNAHAHSPRRTLDPWGRTIIPYYADPTQSVIHPIPPPTYQSKWAPKFATASGMPRNPMSACDDPFMGPPPMPASTRRWTSSHDVAMPDYPHSNHSRAYTEMSEVLYDPKDFERSMNDAAVEEIVKALSPDKKDKLIKALSPEKIDHAARRFTGTPTLPPVCPQVSPAAQARAASYGQALGRTISLDVNPSIDLSRSTSASSRPEQGLSKFPPPRYSQSPASSVHSKKDKVIILADEDEEGVGCTTVANNQVPFMSSSTILIRQPLVEGDETNRRRSTSNASKRKRSLSLKKSNLDKASPASSKGKHLTLEDSVYSPSKKDDASPQAGGVALGL